MKLITNNFKLNIAEQLEEYAREGNYYGFLANPQAFNGDVAVPTPVDDQNTSLFRTFKHIICGKNITSSDVALGVKKSVWTANTVYTQYEHNAVVFGTDFYTATPGAVSGYDVFKCLSNANGSPSTYYPRLGETSPADAIYETIDGYQWKYMYSITEDQWNKFTTTDFMPVYTNANVAANAVNGTIDYVEVVYGGSGYDMFNEGLVQGVQTIGIDQFITIEPTASTTTDFYKNCAIKIGSELRLVAEYSVTGSLRRVKVNQPFTVTPTTSDNYYISPVVQVSTFCCGDGEGFQARALVNATSSNSIYKVEIVDRGSNFTFANVSVLGGVTTVSNTAIFKPMISPKGGHGLEPAAELGCKEVILSLKFDSELSGGKILDTNDFRTFGILKDPRFANVELAIANSTGSFTLLETITGGNSGAYGTLVTSNTSVMKLTNVRGFFETSETVIGEASEQSATVTDVTQPTIHFDQTLKLVIDDVTGTFVEDEEVYQGETQADKNANGSMYFANSSLVYLTDARGTFNVSDDVSGVVHTIVGNTSGATAKVTAVVSKDLVDYEGKIVYIENMAAVTKIPSQTETVRVVLEF